MREEGGRMKTEEDKKERSRDMKMKASEMRSD